MNAVTILGLSKVWNNSDTSATVFLPTNAAFERLAATYNRTTNDLVLAYPDTLLKIPSYHIVNQPVRLEPLRQLVAAGVKPPGPLVQLETSLGSYDNECLWIVANATSVVVQSTSSTAAITEMDVPAGASYVNVIDSVLLYWYPDLETALTGIEGISTFAAAASLAAIPASIKAASGVPQNTLFAPTDQAFVDAQATAPVNLTTSKDTVGYHWVPSYVIPNFNRTYNASNNKYLSYSNTLLGNESVSNLAGVPSKVVRWVPVGARPDVSIYVIDKVLLPTYTSAWQALQQMPQFSLAYGLFQKNPAVASKLQDGGANLTVFAPTNAAIISFVLKQFGVNGGNLSTAVSSDKLKSIIGVHVATKTVTLADIRSGLELDTLYAAKSLKTKAAGSAATVQAQETGATLISPLDTEVNFGRAYLQAIDSVLSPVPLKDTTTGGGGGGGAAGRAVPSLLLAVVMAGLVGRLLAWA